ncbi:uncharacterized protein LOC123214659 isoform X2 [Mangifera indica]|uniref:uncharacterized protein LOC123214659 isoform X2 n=1 Tax=Mangifera indica TaxID=29780 RepID=UPI001CFA2D8E|nr:uncharacterized protein LOC123214659 isoform X2 [Mangifera indica]
MIVQNILRSGCSFRSFVFFPRPTSLTSYYYIKYPPPIHIQNLQIPSFSSLKPTPPSAIGVRFVSTSKSTSSQDHRHQHPLNYEEEIEEGETTDGWEEEDEAEPEVGDGGDGGGVVLQGVSWGERALSIAHEVLLQFGNDMNIYAFKTTPRGYVYVRLDKMSNKYGCPSMEELETYSQEYKKKLDEVGAQGEIPDDLALEVQSGFLKYLMI